MSALPVINASDRSVTVQLQTLVDRGVVRVLSVTETATGTRWSVDTGNGVPLDLDEWRLWSFIHGYWVGHRTAQFVVPSDLSDTARREVA